MTDLTGTIKIINPKSLEEDTPVTHRRRRKKSSISVVTNDGTATFRSRTMGSSILGGHSSQLSKTNAEMEEHDKKSEVVVRRLKTAILLFFTLTAVGVATAFFVYRSHGKRARETAFRNRFREEAYSMLANIGANLDSTLGATDAFTVSMLAQAEATNQTYPFVTIDNFAVQAGKLLKNSRAKFISTLNYVQKGQRREWEAYAKTHNSWIEQSIGVQSRDPGYRGPEITDEFLEENYYGNYDLIHDYDEAFFGWDNSTDGVDHEGPYLVTWQQVPVIPMDPLYNWYVFVFTCVFACVVRFVCLRARLRARVFDCGGFSVTIINIRRLVCSVNLVLCKMFLFSVSLCVPPFVFLRAGTCCPTTCIRGQPWPCWKPIWSRSPNRT